MTMNVWQSGRESSLLDLIISGHKTVDGRLDRGKFAQYAIGDIVALRRDVRGDDGVLRDGVPDQARVQIIAIRRYATFLSMVQAEGFTCVIPTAATAYEAADEYNRFYSADDQARYGVLAIEIRLML